MYLSGVHGALDDVENGDVAALLGVRGHHDVFRLRQSERVSEGEGVKHNINRSHLNYHWTATTSTEISNKYIIEGVKVGFKSILHQIFKLYLRMTSSTEVLRTALSATSEIIGV